MDAQGAIVQLRNFIGQQQRLLVITGAGCSTASGIPAYRNASGQWRARKPIQHHEFVTSHSVRQRYWARSIVGWRQMAQAQPNPVHTILAGWESEQKLELLVTQNVDGLHRRAGSRRLVELHGSLDTVTCLHCHEQYPRGDIQARLVAANEGFCQAVTEAQTQPRPDGDAELFGIDYTGLALPSCPACGGVLMPNVVFFGGSVPKETVSRVEHAVHNCTGVLVVGSTLSTLSGLRICKQAHQLGRPIVIINIGVTRADELAQLKYWEDCVAVLQEVDHLRQWAGAAV
jgi:NAD-dependent SIR2 family protein deacetylase